MATAGRQKRLEIDLSDFHVQLIRSKLYVLQDPRSRTTDYSTPRFTFRHCSIVGRSVGGLQYVSGCVFVL